MKQCEKCATYSSYIKQSICSQGHATKLCNTCLKDKCIKCRYKQSYKLCTYCKKQPLSIQLDCKKHGLCKLCAQNKSTLKCAQCYQPCQDCKKRVAQKETKCKHNVCKICFYDHNCAKLQAYKVAYCCIRCTSQPQSVYNISNCRHNHCAQCIANIIYDHVKTCLCGSSISSQKLEKIKKMIFSEVGTSHYQLKCFKCGKIEDLQYKSAPQYYKCNKCSELNCLIHKCKMEKCKCKCSICLKSVQSTNQKQKCHCNLSQIKHIKNQCSLCKYETTVIINNLCKSCYIQNELD